MKLSKYIPQRTVTYKAKLSITEVYEKLEAFIAPNPKFKLQITYDKPEKPYTGRLYGNQFTIRRWVDRKNSFLPQIDGILLEKLEGTEVRISMQLPELIKAFLIGWNSMAFIFGVLFLFMPLEETILHGLKILPFAFIGFFYLIVKSTTEHEMDDSQRDFEKLLEVKARREF